MGAFFFIGLVNEVSIGCDAVTIKKVEVPLAEHGIHLWSIFFNDNTPLAIAYHPN